MDSTRVARVREEMERAEARRLQPHYIESFFLEAFRRLGGTVRLDPARVGRDASRIAEGVIAHLTGLVGAHVEVTLEIAADERVDLPCHGCGELPLEVAEYRRDGQLCLVGRDADLLGDEVDQLVHVRTSSSDEPDHRRGGIGSGPVGARQRPGHAGCVRRPPT